MSDTDFKNAWGDVERACSGEDPDGVPLSVLQEGRLWCRAFPNPPRPLSLNGRMIKQRQSGKKCSNRKQQGPDHIQFLIKLHDTLEVESKGMELKSIIAGAGTGFQPSPKA